MSIQNSRHKMPGAFDISVYSRDRQLVLLAEIKWDKESSEQNATYYRRNLLSHGLLSSVPFFLLANRSTLNLWRGTASPDEAPTYTAAAKPIFKRYLGPLADDERGPGSESLQFALTRWLSEFADESRAPDQSSDADQMVINSGLAQQLKGGEVREELPQ